jgi:hypothetical protein
MSEEAALRAVPVPADQVDFLIATAARAIGAQHAAVAVPGS